MRPDEEMKRIRSISEPGAEPVGQMTSEAPASRSGDTGVASPGPIRTERRRVLFKSPCVLAAEEDQAVDNAFVSQGPADVLEHTIPRCDWGHWDPADSKELAGVLLSGAIRVLSVSDSLSVVAKLKTAGDGARVLPSHMVRRIKPPQAEGEVPVYTSRWCVRGDRGPAVFDLELFAAPTLATTSLYFAMLLTA